MKRTAFIPLFLLAAFMTVAITASPLSAQEGTDGEESMGYFDRQCLEILKAIVIKKLPRDLYMAQMDTFFFGLRGAEIRRFRMTENADFRKTHPYVHPVFMATDRILVHINPLPLFTGQVLVTDMQLEDTVFQIVRDENGDFNFDDLSEAQDSKLIKWLHIKELLLNNAELHVLDNGAINKPIRYMIDQVDVAVNDFQIGEVFKLDIKARSPAAATQNIFMHGEAGPMKLNQKNEEIPLDVDFDVVKLPVTPYNRYVFPKRSPVIPVAGEMNVDFAMRGDFWSGLVMTGNMGIGDLVLQSTDDFIQGEPIYVEIGLEKPMKLSLEKDRLDIPAMEMVFNGNKFLVSGEITNLYKIPEANLDVRSGDIDIDVINAVYPFITESLPEDLYLNGHYSMNFHISGTQLKAQVDGHMDLTKFSFGFGKFFQKPPQTKFVMDFDGIVNTSEVIETGASFVFEDCLVGHYNFICDILAHFLRKTENRSLKKRLLETYGHLPHQFDTVRGELFYKDNLLLLNNIRMTNLSAQKAPGIDVLVNGRLDFSENRLDIKGNVTVSHGLTRKILMANPGAGQYLQGESLVFGFQHAGYFDDFRLTIFPEPLCFSTNPA